MTSRRQFLSGCSTLALAAAVSPAALSAASVFGREAGPELLTYKAFSKCLNSTFILHREAEQDVRLELTDACEQQPSGFETALAADASHEKFSLMFRGPQTAVLPQNTYTFEHGRLGRFEMFIVPVGVQNQTHGCYEAIFNRPLDGGTNQRHENKNKL
jgi:hypothetical protein